MNRNKATIYINAKAHKKIRNDAKKRNTSFSDACNDALCNFYGVKNE